MRIRTTLVNPPYPQGSHQHPPFIPLGIGYLAAVLEKNQHTVDVIDCQALKLSYEDFRSEISKRKPNVVGITSTTLTYKSALKIAEITKQVHPDCITILGGSHATFWDDNALEECSQLDIVVRKEGENTLLEIVDMLKNNKDISDVQGTTCRRNGKIIRNIDRPYIENLDDLPLPAHHLFPLGHLQKYGTVVFPLSTSRGCTSWCNFCSAVRMFGRRYRMRSSSNVVDEIEFLVEKYGAFQFTFYDDAFTIDQSRVQEICKEIQKRKLKVKWDCEARVDMVTKDLLQEMKKAGCIAIWFGVESGSQSVIDAMGKGITPEKTKRAFKWTGEAGIMTIASVVIGFPGETPETAWETIRLVDEINPDDIGYYVATPYPGTPMFEYVKKMNWLKITDFNKFDTATPVFETPTLSMKELREIRDQAFQRFYLRPTYVLRRFAEGGLYGFASTKAAFAHFLKAIKSKLQQ